MSTESETAGGGIGEHELDGVIYTLCFGCDHFVEQEDEGWIHLSDDDHPWLEDHDPTPASTSMSLGSWKQQRPDLFFAHSDGHIGPNSSHHHHDISQVTKWLELWRSIHYLGVCPQC